MNDLFSRYQGRDSADHYPNVPAATPDDTSIAAADSLRAQSADIRDRVLAALKGAGYTVHEMTSHLGLTVPSVQPRFSELRALTLIVDTGLRRVNLASGRKAIVWSAKP